MTVLVGKHVRLEPLALAHAEDLFTHIGNDDVLARDLAFHTPHSVADITQIITGALIERDAGEREPFAVMYQGECIGSTSYLDQVPVHRRVEIGWTFYGQAFWRSAVNTECKLLLMTEAFEVRGYDRLCLKTDTRNERSQRAIERLGATHEGVLRHLVIRKDSTPRDSVFYSVLADEWPAVKAKLEKALA